MGDNFGMRRLTDLDDDSLHEICLAVDQLDVSARESSRGQAIKGSTLLNFCTTCRRLRSVGRPVIFRKPKMLSDCADGLSRLPSIDPWLTYIENSEPFLRYMKQLNIKMFAMMELDVARLANILSQARSLTDLELITPESRDGSKTNLKKAIRASSLKRLQSLTISSGLEDLIPDLSIRRSLRINDEAPWYTISTDLLQLYAIQGHLEHMVHLQLSDTTAWSPNLLQTFSEHLPALRTLGTVRGGKPGYSFEALLKQGNLFPRLEQLRIAPGNRLGLRWFDPHCTNYVEECNPPNWFCDYHVRDALQYAGRVVYSAIRNLQLVRFDDEKYLTCIRDDHGDVVSIDIVIGTEAMIAERTRIRQIQTSQDAV